MPRHFLDLFDLDRDDARRLIARAAALKAGPIPSPGPASGRFLALIFEKPSLRTRVSFEAAMARLGGASTFLRGEDVGLGVRESVRDFARVIGQYADVLAIRTFSHRRIDELALHATIPVVNALSDDAHPCQVMADVLTIRETFGTLDGIKVAFVGDGNNVARSLAVASALFGIEFVLGTPEGYDFPLAFREKFARTFPSVPLNVSNDPIAAVSGAKVIYTDVWTSMGQEEEASVRQVAFGPYQVNAKLFASADPKAVLLHCLPAHRGEEVTEEVLDSDRSLVIPQAGNRLHFQMALLDWLLTG